MVWLTELIKQLSELFKNLVDKSSAESSMRWVFIFTFIFINVTVWITWFGLSLAKYELQSFPSSLVGMVNMTFLIITGGFALNKSEETKQGDKKPPV